MELASTFGQRLKAARIMAGLSMDNLVERLGKRLSKAAISKYENGLMMPDSNNLLLLAGALNVGPDFFFSAKSVDFSSVNFRKKAALGEKAIKSLTERIKDAMNRYIELETLLGLDVSFHNPLEDVEVGDVHDIEEAALKLRSAWNIGHDAAIPNLLNLLEEHSLRVIELDEHAHFDGLSGKVDGYPFIVINRKLPTDRKRLTALHEFAHQTLKFKSALPANSVEKLCHAFGGAFLMPSNVLRRELGEKRNEISLPELYALKKEYGISMQAIMVRAKQTGIISEYVFEQFMRTMSAHGWRKDEPVQYPAVDAPHRFELLLHRALAEGVISISKAAYLARKSVSEIEKELASGDADSHP